ncbi:MAG: hypothetical protein WD598_18155 [Acidimicrobiia bacterium]
MKALATVLPVLACGAMMIGCMLMMGRMHHKRDDADAGELDRLRQENDRLRNEHDQRSAGGP